MAQIHDYTYGVYSENGDDTIYYLSVNLSTHSHFQRYFSGCFDNDINPCDLIHKFTRTKITTLSGLKMNGYDLKPTEDKAFMREVFRPSLQSPHQNKVRDFKWVVPEEVVLKLVDYDNKPMTSLIDFFLIIKDLFPRIADKKLKSYAIRLLENNIIDLNAGIKLADKYMEGYSRITQEEMKALMEDIIINIKNCLDKPEQIYVTFDSGIFKAPPDWYKSKERYEQTI